ncbi:MAG TPA: hypothetical protein DDZ42_03080 [Candidatus Rokubacteria bacterium]|nr:MAG: hypothetical protein A2X52_18805 [Candidatus Rokubacteria bacterium GWC2_70_16]HBH00897.1 hypothetical protein [Candidatus Rokubacteria bacterium]
MQSLAVGNRKALAPARAPRVLVVEDDADMAAVVRDALAAAGFAVALEGSGEGAIAAAERERFDAVIVDKELPSLSGLDLVSFLSHRAPSTPIVLLTAFGGALVAAAARLRGATHYLEKPVRLAALVDTVRALVRGAAPADATPAALAGRGAPRPSRAPAPARGGGPRLWSIVLAGGQGTRLRPLVRRLLGEERPKQFTALVDGRSMFCQTLDRSALAVPAARTVVVSLREHARYLVSELAGRPAPTVLLQPEDRGTAAGILLPAHWVARRDPGATVVVLPSDHLVREERLFMDRVEEAAAFVDRHPQWLVLLGAPPTEPETEYGWIEPGEEVGWTARRPVRRVRRFVEKPPADVARACLARGALWNTFVFVARAETLLDAGRQFAWRLHEALGRVPLAIGGEALRRALTRAYAAVPRTDFSTAILEECVPILAVLEMAGVTWSDLGSPRRLLRVLQQTADLPSTPVSG